MYKTYNTEITETNGNTGKDYLSVNINNIHSHTYNV